VGKLWKMTSNCQILFTLPLIPSHQGKGDLTAPSPLEGEGWGEGNKYITHYKSHRTKKFFIFSMNPKTITPVCKNCIYYYITWDKKNPYGCKVYGFKTSGEPSRIVKNASGEECRLFSPKNISVSNE